MAFPSVRSSQVTAFGNGQAQTDVVMPTPIEAGDTLVIWGRVATTGAFGPPGDWTELLDQTSAGDAIFLAYKKADGTEDGTSVTITHGSSKPAFIAFAVQGAADPTVTAPQISTLAESNSNAPDPTAVTPTGGAKDYLVAWLGSWEGEQTSPPSGNPTNYSGVVAADTGTGGAVTSNCRATMAVRQVNTDSEDPGSWTISSADDWAAVAMAFHPAAAAFSEYEILGRPYGRSGERQMTQLLPL